MALQRPRARWPLGIAGIVLSVAAISCRQHSGPPQHYDDPEAMIAVFEDEQRDAWQMPERVIRALNLEAKDAIVADIGAGSGYFTRRLAQQVPEGRVYAVDVDREFEDHLLDNREAWGTPNIEPHLALYDDPMLPVEGLDLVFAANTYAYIRDRPTYFTKVRKALKPGGRLALIDFRPDATPPGNIAPKPEHRISRDQAVSELQQAGFVVQGEETFLPHQWFLILQPQG